MWLFLILATSVMVENAEKPSNQWYNACSHNCTKYNRSSSSIINNAQLYTIQCTASHICICLLVHAMLPNIRKWFPGYIHNVTTIILLKMQCNSLKALELFNTSITSNESVLAIVGCGCSLATEEVASRSDIPVVRELLKLNSACTAKTKEYKSGH